MGNVPQIYQLHQLLPQVGGTSPKSPSTGTLVLTIELSQFITGKHRYHQLPSGQGSKSTSFTIPQHQNLPIASQLRLQGWHLLSPGSPPAEVTRTAPSTSSPPASTVRRIPMKAPAPTSSSQPATWLVLGRILMSSKGRQVGIGGWWWRHVALR